MARNDDEAARRRAKRRERLDKDASSESGAPADDAAAAPGPADEQQDAEPALVGDTMRAETEAHAGLTGSPVGIGEPESDAGPHSELEPAAGGATVGGEPAKQGGPRLFSFFRASWAELQRVRWPDRQQVAQGTAVTLGFVVVAGAFLGAADVVARQIVNLIL